MRLSTLLATEKGQLYKRAHKTHSIGEKVETIAMQLIPSGHSDNIHNTCTGASVFVNGIHARLITFDNPEMSCIRMRSGPALFGLARVYCIEFDQQALQCRRFIHICAFLHAIACHVIADRTSN